VPKVGTRIDGAEIAPALQAGLATFIKACKMLLKETSPLQGSTEQTMAKTATTPTAKNGAADDQEAASPSQIIDAKIAELRDWRGAMLARVRALIKEADADVVESVKWRGVPVWEHAGIICTGETYKSVVKLTFLKGASLEDPSRLFNSSLEGNARRAIDLREGEALDEEAFKALIRAAVALNASSAKRPKAASARSKT